MTSPEYLGSIVSSPSCDPSSTLVVALSSATPSGSAPSPVQAALASEQIPDPSPLLTPSNPLEPLQTAMHISRVSSAGSAFVPLGCTNPVGGQHSLGQSNFTEPASRSIRGLPAPLVCVLRRLANNTSPSAVHTVARAEVAPRPGHDFYGIPNPSPGTPLRLADLRERLIRQEETIIFALIERAQFRLNPIIYTRGAFPIPNFDGTFSQYLLYELEKAYSKVRRYTSPDEHPFAPMESLPEPLLEPLDYPSTLIQNNINYNEQIEILYHENILPVVCENGDDQNYGSSATCDVACLQALSKRIHYGKFIAEAKYQENPEHYAALARAGDKEGIWKLLSDENVERILFARVENKARSYGVDVTHGGLRDVYKVDPRAIAEMYRDFIIPLTKVVEVDYLMERHLVYM